MFLIECPFCHEARTETEFSYAGEAFIERPKDPESLDDQSWADYLFHRTNTKGAFWEQWSHSHGCRKFFVLQRDTATNEILGSYTLADARDQIAKREKTENLATRKLTAKKSTAKKSATKKVAVKKPVAKKSTTKKAAVKKPVAKKSAIRKDTTGKR